MSFQAEETPLKENQEMIELDIAGVDDGTIPLAVLAADSHLNPDHRLLTLEKRRARDLSVFPKEGENLTSLPRPNHWSIAWSDLMMTMFVLFFVMFIHQAEQNKKLDKEKIETIAAKALQQPARTIFLREKIEVSDSEKRVPQQKSVAVPIVQREEPPQPVVLSPRGDNPVRHPLKAPSYTAPGSPQRIPGSIGEVVEVIDNQGLEANRQKDATHTFEKVYNEGQDIVKQNQLEDFAAINIATDNTIHLVLSGDLLFPSAQATLTTEAKTNLLLLAEFIARAPYTVHIEGHTDNLPIASSRFPSNWELSLARANSVARFLMREAELDPGQLAISGYSSYRPIASNETVEGRAKNRRVEIILAPARTATRRIKPSL
ncbi:hypothetical protein CSB45_00230 [candidate division KSB3 bacterium]|uniref:OmpA-like domain-containing protein n=1 Tax=candidate division KSB3 bacterium TaxID=2044937 RepID=A0A2G6EEG5_9BACT|nr:MAG: hypothetical protein CSB45_00230 [candidate division KSB3 bacterium]